MGQNSLSGEGFIPHKYIVCYFLFIYSTKKTNSWLSKSTPASVLSFANSYITKENNLTNL